jgi:hypothetical protein
MPVRVSRNEGDVRVGPSSEADLARGGALLCHLGGPQGAARATIVSCACVRLEVSARFAFFFRVLSRIPMVV